MVTKSTLDNGEDYASAGDILNADDLPHTTVTVWGWKANGGPLKLRVRGLSLAQRETVRATTWREDGRRDTVALIVGYLRYGVVVPSLNDEQARQIAEKHAGTVEQLSDYINMLTELDYGHVEALANELAQNDEGGGPAPTPAGTTRAADGPLD
jgi:hypothetical protein